MLRKGGLDKQAVMEGLVRLVPQLAAYARRLLIRHEKGWEEKVREAVQETCVLALEKLNQLRDPDCFEAWLFQILRNVIRCQYRARPVVPLDKDGLAGQTRVAPDLTQPWKDRYDAKVQIAMLVEHLPPGLARYVRGKIQEGYDQEPTADRDNRAKHRCRREQERLIKCVWKKVGMETELGFLRRVHNFVKDPCPRTSTALLASAKKENQLNFAHMVLMIYHVALAENLSNRLALHRGEASDKSQATRSLANSLLWHAKLCLQSANVIGDSYFQGTAHELAAKALFGQIECLDGIPEALTLSLMELAEEWGAAGTHYAEAEAIGAMIRSRCCQAIVLKNIGHEMEARRVLEAAWRVCREYADKAGMERLSQEIVQVALGSS